MVLSSTVDQDSSNPRFTDYHFGNGAETGQQRTLWGYYVDELVKSDVGWRIEKRDTIKTAGPFYSVSEVNRSMTAKA